jgi:alpha-ketoglutarate-dependent taurine dioxygenase
MSQFMSEAPQLKMRLNEARSPFRRAATSHIVFYFLAATHSDHHPRHHLISRCPQGEVLIFNNRRMVHGRCAFECPKGESRHLQGA